jgi:sugar lactone lactonase YvrE
MQQQRMLRWMLSTRFFYAHPDMTPRPMDDGNILVSYKHSVVNIVLTDVAKANWPEIEARHQDGLPPNEVLITPLGSNVFDDFGKMALLGRCYMFMDAQQPSVIRIERKIAQA